MRLRSALLGRWNRGRKAIHARIGDINADGMFVETDESIAPGQVMDLVVDLPSGPIAFLAVSRLCGQTRHGRGIGVSIFKMEPADRSRWNLHYRAVLGEAMRAMPASVAELLGPR